MLIFYHIIYISWRLSTLASFQVVLIKIFGHKWLNRFIIVQFQSANNSDICSNTW